MIQASNNPAIYQAMMSRMTGMNPNWQRPVPYGGGALGGGTPPPDKLRQMQQMGRFADNPYMFNADGSVNQRALPPGARDPGMVQSADRRPGDWTSPSSGWVPEFNQRNLALNQRLAQYAQSAGGVQPVAAQQQSQAQQQMNAERQQRLPWSQQGASGGLGQRVTGDLARQLAGSGDSPRYSSSHGTGIGGTGGDPRLSGQNQVGGAGGPPGGFTGGGAQGGFQGQFGNVIGSMMQGPPRGNMGQFNQYQQNRPTGQWATTALPPGWQGYRSGPSYYGVPTGGAMGRGGAGNDNYGLQYGQYGGRSSYGGAPSPYGGGGNGRFPVDGYGVRSRWGVDRPPPSREAVQQHRRQQSPWSYGDWSYGGVPSSYLRGIRGGTVGTSNQDMLNRAHVRMPAGVRLR